MNFRGQYALEQMSVVALALAIIGAVFFFAMSSASDSARVSQAKDTAERIAKAADSAYSLGPGSRSTVSISMPQGVQLVNISNKRVLVRVATSSGTADAFAATHGQLVGYIPTTGDQQEITLTVLPSGDISVGRTILVCSPNGITKTIQQGGSSSDTLTLTNVWTSGLSAFTASISGVSDMVSNGTLPSTLASSGSTGVTLSFLVPGAKAVGTYTGSITVNASNSSSCTSSITVFVTSSSAPDSIGPTLSGLAIAPGSPTIATAVNVSATATDTNNTVSSCALELDNSGVWNSMSATDGSFSSGTEAINYYLGTLELGSHTVSAFCTDSLGNAGSISSLDFSVANVTGGNATADTQGPLVSNITITVPGPCTSATTIVNATASDATTGASKVMHCQLQLNGGGASYMDPAGGLYNAVTIAVSKDLGPLGNGNYNVSIYCTDVADNVGAANTSSFNITMSPLCVYARTDPNGTQSAAGVSLVDGYCLAVSTNSTNISYFNYTWWLNSAVNASGQFQPQTQSNATMAGAVASFSYDAGFTSPANANDANYATFASYTAFSTASMYWNYTNPANSTNETIWQTRHGTAATANDTLPSACAAQPTVRLKITANNSQATPDVALDMTLLKNYTKSTAPCGLLGSRKMQMDWENSRAYVSVSSRDALTVIDFSNPSSLACRGSIADSAAPGSLDGIWGGKLDAERNIFYAPSITDDTISVYNVSGATPAYMAGTASVSANPYSLDGVSDIEYIDIAGSRLLVASAGTDSTVSVYNATNPLATPTGIYTYTKSTNPCASTTPSNLKFIPGTTYLIVAASGIDTITILNISANGVLTCVGSYASSAPPYSVDGAQDFYYEESTEYLYVPSVTDRYLTILNIANRASITAVGEVYLDATGVSVAVNTVGSKKFAFVGSTTAGKGIKVVDVTNPSGLVLNQTFNQTSGTCVYNTVYGIASSGNMLYATSGGDSCFYSIKLYDSAAQNYSESSKSCYNGTTWEEVGMGSFATNNFSAANIYEQGVFFNTTSFATTPTMNNTEYLVNSLNRTFAAGQNWTLTCIGVDNSTAVSTNSTALRLT